MLRLRRSKALDHRVECLVPSDPYQFAVLAQQRILRAIFSVDGVMFRKTFGTELAAIHWMRSQGAGCDCLALLDSDLNAAADRAIAARRRHPAIGDLLRGGVPGFDAACERIFFLERVQTCHALPIHAALPIAVKAAAMLFGTTLTKKSQRPSNSPPSASVRAAMARMPESASSGSTIPAATSRPKRSRKACRRRAESRSADARNSNCSERDIHRNLRVCVSSCAAPPATAARASQVRSIALKVRWSKARTKRGPSSRAVETNSAMVWRLFHAGLAGTI